MKAPAQNRCTPHPNTLRLSYLGLLAFVALIPFETSFLLLEGVGATITRFLGIGILLVWAAEVWIDHQRVVIPRALRLAIVFVVWGALSLKWAWDKTAALQDLVTAVQLLVLAFLVVNLVNTPRRLMTALAVLFLGCFAVAVLGLLGIGVATEDTHLALKNQGAKEYGAYAGLAFLIASLMLTVAPLRLRWLAAVGTATTAIPILASGERGVVFALALAWMAVISATRKKIAAGVAGVLAVAILLFLLRPAISTGRISQDMAERFSINSVLETGGSGRDDIWRVGWAMVKDNPWLGVGIGNFESAVGVYSTRVETRIFVGFGRGAHADWLEVCSALGMLGMCLFMGLLISSGWGLLKQVYRPLATDQHVAAVLVWALFVYMFSLGLTSTFIWRKVYWVVLGLTMVCPRLFVSGTTSQPTSPSTDRTRSRRSASRTEARRGAPIPEGIPGAPIIQRPALLGGVEGQVWTRNRVRKAVQQSGSSCADSLSRKVAARLSRS